jgi:hypothetical protein
MNQLSLFPTNVLHIQKITIKEARTLLSKYHYLKSCSNNASCFGAFENNILVGVVAFQIPCSEKIRENVYGAEYKQYIIELGRLVLHPTCKTLASQIVSKCIEALQAYRIQQGKTKYKAIISFADTKHGHHGGVYQAMSWLYCGTTRKYTTYYKDKDNRIRHPRQQGKNITVKQALEKGWTLEKSNVCKHRYIKLLGTKKQKKQLRKILKYSCLKYPCS